MRIGILCSIPEERKHFNLIKDSAQKFGGRTFFKSKNHHHELIVVECGLGKVNAAIASTLLIQKFKCKLLIFSGIAGGIDPDMRIGDVLIGESIIQYDYGAKINSKIQVFRAGKVPMGASKNKIDFRLNPKIKKLIEQQLPHLRMGKILTGDVFLQCDETRKTLFKKFRAQAIDMESGAVVQVAEQFKTIAIVVRCLSDLANTKEKKMAFKNIKQASEISYKTVEALLKILKE